jgi:hypothetical protein
MNFVQTSKIPLAISSMALALFANSSVSAAGSDLQGCWQGESVVVYLKDGRGRTQAGDCSFKITSDRIFMRCTVSAGDSLIEYTYRITKPGTYTATMASHNSRPDLVGATRDYEYRLEGDRLLITTYPQTTIPSPPTSAVKVESVSVRAACK